MNVKIKKPAPAKRIKTLSYEACEDFTIKKILEIKKKQFLKDWCKDNNINYITLTNFFNRKLKKKTPNVMSAVLQALGYEVTFHKEIIFKICKDNKD